MKFYAHKRKNLVMIEEKACKSNNYMQEYKQVRKNLSLMSLLGVYCVMIVGFLLLFPMIYIKNQIYYNSRDISVLMDEYAILYEENQVLRKKIEYMRYKSQILDTLDIE